MEKIWLRHDGLSQPEEVQSHLIALELQSHY